VDACTGGYAEPGFCDTGRVPDGTDDVVSTLGVNEGVRDFGAAGESADVDR